jgi:hypothetical protein
MNTNENKDKNLKSNLENLLGETPVNELECNTEECRIKEDKSILERVSKKIIVEDGRQLLI